MLAILPGDLSVGRSESPRYQPHALLIGCSIRDIRRPPSARFSETLDTNPVLLYLLGARVHVDVQEDGMNLVDHHGSAIDVVTWADPRRRLVLSRRWADDGPRLGLFLTNGQR